jgi:hypothetical protein
MALAEAPPTTVEPPNAQKFTGPSEAGSWRKVAALWATAVAAQALILLVLNQHGNIVIKSHDLEGVARLLADGRVKDAKNLVDWSFQAPFPTEILVQYALLGMAVILLAWVGRRSLALALPFLIGIVSMSPTFSDVAAITPRPISELDDSWLWQALQMNTTGTFLPDTWPLLVGVALQTALLLLPLAAAPPRIVDVSLASAVKAAALPTLAVTVLALTTLQYSTVTELYWMPAVALSVGLLAAAIVTGAGSAWVRIPTAVAVPAVLGAVTMPFNFSTPFDYSAVTDYSTSSSEATGLGTALAALLIALGTLAVRRLHDRRSPRLGTSVLEVPAAA